MAFLKKSHEPYAIIASADAVYKLDYNKVLERHVETGADITIVCKDIGSTEKALAYGVVTTDSNGRIVDFVDKLKDFNRNLCNQKKITYPVN